MLWFVYRNPTYYPDAMLVEAETADDAVEAMKEEGFPVNEWDGCAIFKLDDMAKWIGNQPPKEMLDVL
jgi:hypothetical protein